MKLIQKVICNITILLFLFLSISFVSSAEIIVTNLNDTAQIQTAISDTNNRIVTFEGNFNNLTTLYIDRNDIKISGNNAVIAKNSSNRNDHILFNISGHNVIIENLKIAGYNTTIFSNSNDILIQNNHIESLESAINMTKVDGINNITIINNNISTTRPHAYGIYFDSKEDLINSLISNNRITTRSTDAHGIYLRSSANFGFFKNIIVFNNTINTGTGRGIYLYSSFGNMSDNLVYGNNISTTGATAHGIWIYANRTNMTNTEVFENNIITTGNNARGISLYVNTGNGTHNVISNNNVTTKGKNTSSGGSYGSIYVYTFTHALNNTIITRNNIIANSTAIYVGTGSSGKAIINHLNISYNKILSNNTFILVQKSGVNVTASANWFGNNTPSIEDTSKFFNINILDYYVVNASYVNNSGIVGGNWTINYTFYLNNTEEVGEFSNLPVFMTQLFNSPNIEISQWFAYDTKYQQVTIDQPTNTDLYIVLDNEKILLGTFSADKGNTNLTIEVIGDLGINKTVTIIGTLKNIQGQLLENKNVTLYINGIPIDTKITDTNGQVSFTHKYNKSENINFKLEFQEDEFYYDTTSEEINLFVPKISTDLSIDIFGNSIINETAIITGILRDIDRNPLSNRNVTLYINGIPVDTKSTDINGQVSFTHKYNKSENINFKLEFQEEEFYYGNTSKEISLFISKIVTDLSIDVSNNPDINKIAIITGILKSRNGKFLANQNVTLFINGIPVDTKITDTNGQVSFNYSYSKRGRFSFKLGFEENEFYYGCYSEVITRNIPKIITDLSMKIFHNSNIDKIAIINGILKDSNGKFLANQNVILFVNGVMTEIGITNVDGYVSFNYAFKRAGTYTIKLEFYETDDYYSSNSNIEKLVVNLIPTQLTIIYEGTPKVGNLIEIIAKLSSNNSISGEEIIFFVNGKEIGRNYTNSKGIAILHYIIPKSGKYEFSAIFLGSDSYNSSYSPFIDVFVKSANGNNNNENIANENNNISPDVNAPMENTGIPLIILILSSLAILGFVIKKF